MPKKATPGQTLLTEDEKQGLLPPNIVTREELNQWEQTNVLEGHQYAFVRKRNMDRLLTAKFIRTLHKRMFSNVWAWAGQFRMTEKNIGIEWHKIPVEIKKLSDDTSYWLKHDTYSHDEACIRFHHRLVAIHPFPNGNGRHGRLMSDVILHNLGEQPFTWGKSNITRQEKMRKLYIEALLEADYRGNYSSLLKFARS